MKKVISILVVLQVVFLILGYGAGTFLGTSDHAEEISSTNSDDSHGSATVSDNHSGDSADHNGEADKEPIVVKLGQMLIPVYKPRSVSYVVINLGISVENLDVAEHYNIGANGVMLRDAIFASLKKSADGRAMRGAVIDTETISKALTEGVQQKFAGINDVLFLDFYKKDIARS